MKEYEVADKTYNKDTGELEQFLIFWTGGEPELKPATPENILLFDPEDTLPFENGLLDFLNGEEALMLSEDPMVVVAPTNNEYSYMLRVRDNVVETTPQQAESILQGILSVAEDDDVSDILDVFQDIMSNQVRQRVINALVDTFDSSDRITKATNGWLIDGYYLVDWSASLYTRDDDPDEDDYVRSGGSVSKDASYEFVQLRMSREARDPENVEIRLNDDEYALTEREMLFLAKVKWLLHRRHYHPDEPFWMSADQKAEVDWKTGEPEDDDEPSSGTFNL